MTISDIIREIESGRVIEIARLRSLNKVEYIRAGMQLVRVNLN